MLGGDSDVEACLNEVVRNVVGRFELAEGQWRSTVQHLEDQVRSLQRQLIEQAGQQGEKLLHQAHKGTLSPAETCAGRQASSAKLSTASSSHEDHVDPMSDNFVMRGVKPNWRPFESSTGYLSASACAEKPPQELDGSVSVVQELTPGPRRTSNVEIIDPPHRDASALEHTIHVDAFCVGSGPRRKQGAAAGNDGPESPPPSNALQLDRAEMVEFHNKLTAAVANVAAVGAEVKERLGSRIAELEAALSAQKAECATLREELARERTAAAVAQADVQQQESATNELVRLLNEQIATQRATIQEQELELLAMREDALDRDAKEEESIALVNEWYGQVNKYLEQIESLQDHIQILERENELIRDANAASVRELSTVEQLHQQVEALTQRLAATEEKEAAALTGLVERSTLSGVAQAQHHEIDALKKKLSLEVMRARDAESQVEALTERLVVLEARFCTTSIRLHHQLEDGLQCASTAERGLRSTYVASSLDQKLIEVNKEVAALALQLRTGLEATGNASRLPAVSAELELRVNLRSMKDLVEQAVGKLSSASSGAAAAEGLGVRNASSAASSREVVRSALRKPLVYLQPTA